MTLFKAHGCETLTDHALFKFSRSKKVMGRLVLRDTSLIAIIKFHLQDSRTIESSFNAAFDEARNTRGLQRLGAL